MARRFRGAWDRAQRSDGTPEPLADEPKHRDEADPRRLDAGVVGNALHFEAHEIVGDEDAPQFLGHGAGALAADRFFAIEHLGLDLIVPELKFPSVRGTGSRSRRRGNAWGPSREVKSVWVRMATRRQNASAVHTQGGLWTRPGRGQPRGRSDGTRTLGRWLPSALGQPRTTTPGQPGARLPTAPTGPTATMRDLVLLKRIPNGHEDAHLLSGRR